jgi:hypothetical protein
MLLTRRRSTAPGRCSSIRGSNFNLLVSFTAPTVANTRIVANLIGAVAATDNGSLTVDFDNTIKTFNFLPTGSFFNLMVNDIDITPGRTVAVTGNLTSTVVPGPIAGAGIPALMALGGLVWARRRKATAAA